MSLTTIEYKWIVVLDKPSSDTLSSETPPPKRKRKKKISLVKEVDV